MSMNSTFARLALFVPRALSIVTLLGGLAACDPPTPTNPTVDMKMDCRVSPAEPSCGVEPTECVPACGLHEQCNPSNQLCECDSGYVKQGGSCQVDCVANPANPECPTQQQPDLITAYFLAYLDDPDGDLGLYFNDSSHAIKVKNQDKGAAGAHKSSFGLLDVTAKKIYGCEAPFPSGTAPGQTSIFAPIGKYCPIPASAFVMGHQYSLLSCADAGDAVKESNEQNNCWQTTPVTFFAPAPGDSPAESLRRGFGSTVLKTLPGSPLTGVEQVRASLESVQ